MSFKFTLLGLEFSKGSPACADVNIEKREKMAKKKLTPQQEKFKKSVVSCHASTKTKEDFGKCLSEKLTKKKSKSKASKKKR